MQTRFNRRVLVPAFAIGTIFIVLLAQPASPRLVSRQPVQPHATSTPVKPAALPEGVEVPSYEPGVLPLHPGQQLFYQASWIGIPAGTARIQLMSNRKDPSLLTAEAWLQSSKAVDLVFKMRDYLREDVARDPFSARTMFIRQSENKRLDEYRVSFDHGAGLVTMVKTSRRGRLTRKFLSSDPWGPLSGALMALSRPLAPGDRYVFDVFTGSNRYVFDFNVVRREKITVPAGTFDAWRILPGVVYLSDDKLRSQARETTVWVSADGRGLPLRIESVAFFGTVRADLVKVTD